jgi:tetratricopeptide (TPR) repeat protein
VQAARKEDVLNALSRTASTFRTRVGESLTMVDKYDMPLAEATTPSLEALKAYSAASKIVLSGRDLAAAVPLFKRAIELDPHFAMAFASLGFAYGLLEEPALAAENNRRAFQLRDRASDREKFYIAATYDLQVTGNLEKAQQTCELWAQTYPRDLTPPAFLGAMVYPTFGKYDKAVEAAGKLVALDPNFSIGYYQLAFNSMYLARLDDADKAVAGAAARKLELPEFVIQRYDLALARQGGRRQRVGLFEAGAALWQALFGNAAGARQSATAALDASTDREVQYGAALSLALSGELSRAASLASDLEARFPEDTSVRFLYAPPIRAQLALNRGEPAQALELLQIGARYDLGAPPSSAVGFFGMLYPVYLRGVAHLAAHHGAEAAMEFQRIIDHRTIVVSDPIGALAHLQLGRAFVMSGDTAKAKTAYQQFLTPWQDADGDIPILQQARSEYATLQEK